MHQSRRSTEGHNALNKGVSRESRVGVGVGVGAGGLHGEGKGFAVGAQREDDVVRGVCDEGGVSNPGETLWSRRRRQKEAEEAAASEEAKRAKKMRAEMVLEVLARSEDIFRRNAERRRKSAQAAALSGQDQALRTTAAASDMTTTTTEWTGSASGLEESTLTLTTTAPAPGRTVEIRPNTAPTPSVSRQRHIKKFREGCPARSRGGGGGGGGSSAAASRSDRNGQRKRLLAYIRQINPPPVPAPYERAPSDTAGGEVVSGEGDGVATTGATGVAAAAAAVVGTGTERMGCGAKLAAKRAALWRRREKEEEGARIQESITKLEAKRAFEQSLRAIVAAPPGKKQTPRRSASTPSERETEAVMATLRRRGDGVRVPVAKAEAIPSSPRGPEMSKLANNCVVNEQATRRNSGPTESNAEAAERRLQHSRRREEKQKKKEEETAARLLEELHKKREASVASFEARRRRDAAERRRSAQQQELDRTHHLEHLHEISRRSAKLNASARLLAKHRNKAVALAAAVNAAAASSAQNQRGGVAGGLLSGTYDVGVGKDLVERSPNSITLRTHLGERSEPRLSSMAVVDPTHGSRQGEPRALTRSSTRTASRLGLQSPSPLRNNPPEVRERRKKMRRKRRKSRQQQRRQPPTSSSKQGSGNGSGSGSGMEVARATTPSAYPVARTGVTASEGSLQPVGGGGLFAKFIPQVVEREAAEREEERGSFQSQTHGRHEAAERQERGWFQSQAHRSRQGDGRRSGAAGLEWGAEEEAVAVSGGLRTAGADRGKGVASIAAGESRFRRRRNEDRRRAAPGREDGCAPYQVCRERTSDAEVTTLSGQHLSRARPNQEGVANVNFEEAPNRRAPRDGSFGTDPRLPMASPPPNETEACKPTPGVDRVHNHRENDRKNSQSNGNNAGHREIEQSNTPPCENNNNTNNSRPAHNNHYSNTGDGLAHSNHSSRNGDGGGFEHPISAHSGVMVSGAPISAISGDNRRA